MGQGLSNVPPGYDCTVKLLSFEQVLDENGAGWEVYTNRQINKWCNAVTAFIGLEKRGKTHILGKLSGEPNLCQLASHSKHTEGLSAVYLDDDTVVLDTAGLYTAVKPTKLSSASTSTSTSAGSSTSSAGGAIGPHIVDDRVLKMHELTENFRLAVQLTLSSQVVMVFGSFSRLDQELLWDVAKHCSNPKNPKRLLVVANFASVTDLEDLKRLTKEAQELLGAIEASEIIDTKRLQFFHLPEFLCRGRMVALGSDLGQATGEHNKLVYTALRRWISAYHNASILSSSPVDPVVDAMNLHLPHFLTHPAVARYNKTTKSIVLEPSEQLPKTVKIGLKSLAQDRVDEGVGSKQQFLPQMRVERSDASYVIRVLVPGITEGDFKVEYNLDYQNDTESIKVAGERRKVISDSTKEIKDSVDYGVFGETFKLLRGYSSNYQTKYENGVIVVTCPTNRPPPPSTAAAH